MGLFISMQGVDLVLKLNDFLARTEGVWGWGLSYQILKEI